MFFYVVVWFHKQIFHQTIYIKVAYKVIVMVDNNDKKIYQIVSKNDEELAPFLATSVLACVQRWCPF